jgi:hypothetical protein
MIKRIPHGGFPATGDVPAGKRSKALQGSGPMRATLVPAKPSKARQRSTEELRCPQKRSNSENYMTSFIAGRRQTLRSRGQSERAGNTLRRRAWQLEDLSSLAESAAIATLVRTLIAHKIPDPGENHPSCILNKPIAREDEGALWLDLFEDYGQVPRDVEHRGKREDEPDATPFLHILAKRLILGFAQDKNIEAFAELVPMLGTLREQFLRLAAAQFDVAVGRIEAANKPKTGMEMIEQARTQAALTATQNP